MKVGMITQWYDPERGSAAQASVIARALSAAGLDLTVLTGFPNYPSGKVYEGYRITAHQIEHRDGIEVHRVPLVPTHESSSQSRLVNYLSFAAASSAYVTRLFADKDVVFVHLTPATAAVAALVLKLRRRIPFVIQVQDLWPDTVLSSGFLPPRVQRPVEAMLHTYCDYLYRHADIIAVTSPGMADKIHARGVPRDKLVFAPNWADEGVFSPRGTPEGHRGEVSARPFTVMYAGNFGPLQELDALLDVAAALRHRDDIEVVLAGGGITEEHLRGRVHDEGLHNVRFEPPRPFRDMPDLLARGDLHYIGLADKPVLHTTLPSKLQATLAMGKPVLARVQGDAAAVVERARCGVICADRSIEEIAREVERYADDAALTRRQGDEARRYYDMALSQGAAVRTLVAALTKTVESARSLSTTGSAAAEDVAVIEGRHG